MATCSRSLLSRNQNEEIIITFPNILSLRNIIKLDMYCGKSNENSIRILKYYKTQVKKVSFNKLT